MVALTVSLSLSDNGFAHSAVSATHPQELSDVIIVFLVWELNC
jgi:hypothetical protein